MEYLTDDLFIDLFAYRQRENKDPLEDWLTECLAATLRALPKASLIALLSEICGSSEAQVTAVLASAKLDIRTQFNAPPVGRPDMLITLDDVPWILFENKVWHAVSERMNQAGEKSHQLRDYADWLRANGQTCALPLAIGFVTHLTPPPPDFSDCLTYRGLTPYKTSWGNVARKLIELTTDLDDDHRARSLARAFMAFLENRGMSNEMPDSTAFAAAEMYVGQAELLENLVDAMWQRACTIAYFGKTKDYTLKAVPDQGSVSAWRYTAPGPSSPSRDTFVEVGVWFPELGRWYDRDQIGMSLRGAQAYVGLINGDDGYFDNFDGAPVGFLRPASDIVAFKAIVEFSTEPQARGEEIVQWVGDMAENLRAFALAHGLVS